MLILCGWGGHFNEVLDEDFKGYRRWPENCYLTADHREGGHIVFSRKKKKEKWSDYKLWRLRCSDSTVQVSDCIHIWFLVENYFHAVCHLFDLLNHGIRPVSYSYITCHTHRLTDWPLRHKDTNTHAHAHSISYAYVNVITIMDSRLLL